ncbi:MAG: nucleotidyltransferase domain-containing protein [Spirochaetes bacterium]|nr:nucleotidyltransferase domain-containing protein [Spirochaetota bacterium]
MDKRAVFFADKIRKKLSSNVKNIILFGSRARNDHYEGSDYDFLIILKNKTSDIIDEIRDIEVDFLNEFDTLSSALIFNEEEWGKRKNLPIGLNIMKEGKKI